MSNAQLIAQAFGGAKKSGAGYMCKCPLHEDKTASLGVTDRPDGTVLFNCLAGCEWKDLQRLAEDRGLIKSFKMQNTSGYTNGSSAPKKIIYSYQDENGKEVAQKIRTLPKGFLTYRVEDGKVIPKLEGYKPPLYNLPKVIASDTIYLTEGEKDSDNLSKLGFTSTTNIAGASHWNSDYNKFFKNKTVIICQDNDDAGRARTAMILTNLKHFVKELKLFAPDGLPEKGDVTDWLNLGHDPETILSLSTSLVVNAVKTRPKVFQASDWVQQPIVKSPPILEGLFEEGDKIMLVGHSKTRKSFMALQLAICVAANRKFLEFTPHQKKVLMIQFEIKENNFHARTVKMSEGLDIESSMLENLFIVNARGHLRNFEDLEIFIKEVIDEVKPSFIILDPLYKLIDGDESKSEDVKPLLRFFDFLAEYSKAAVLYVHHDKKGFSSDHMTIDRGAGTGTLGRDIDCGIYLTPQDGNDSALVVEFKTRNHADRPMITVEWEDYRFKNSALIPNKISKNSSGKAKATLDQKIEAVLAMIKKQISSGTTEMGVGLFNTLARESGVPRDDLTSVKDRLIDLGAIEFSPGKATKGGSSKTVFLTYREDLPLVGETEYEYFEPEEEIF